MVNESRAEEAVARIRANHPMDAYIADRFIIRFENCRNLSNSTLNRIEKALEIITPKSFIFALDSRVLWNLGSNKTRTTADNFLRTFLDKIDLVKPVAEKLIRKAERAGLSAKFDVHPIIDGLTLNDLPFPTLIFRDKEGSVFWMLLEPKKNILLVHHIQGLSSKLMGGGSVDEERLSRVQKALKQIGYERLKDGLFKDVCAASKGKFREVHYLHPNQDPDSRRPHDHYYAFARRLNLRKTPTRAIRRL